MTMRLLVILLLAMAGYSSYAVSEGAALKGVSAGIIPYACVDNNAQYLLAYDSKSSRQGWGAFGGGAKWNETAIETALREFREETNCVFSEERLKATKLAGPSQSKGFYSYLAQVPFKRLSEITAARKCSDVERAFWVWVPHHDLIKALEDNDKSPKVVIAGPPEQAFYLWSKAAKSLRKALSDEVLPEKDPCQPR